MTVEQNVPLAPFTTLHVGGPARFFRKAASETELVEALAWARAEGVAVAVLGGGSNLLIPDQGFDGLVLHMTEQGIDRQGELFDVAAGVSWDELVQATVETGYAGMECLAGIPGSVGASPVQNIGAYGQEVAQTIETVRALDRHTGSFVELSAAECAFRYRKSIFNTEARHRYILTRVRFRLRPGGAPHLGYADLQRWFAGQEMSPTLPEVAEAVRAIRRGKGMVLIEGDPDTASAGSYFKNPVVPARSLEHLAVAAGVPLAEIPQWAAGEGCTKLSAAWLLERAGFSKGYRLGAAGLSTKHALALTNRGGATCADLLRLEDTIRAGVQQRFGVVLEREPVSL